MATPISQTDQVIVASRPCSAVDLLKLHAGFPQRYPFLLESVAKTDSGDLGRYDILFAFPQEEVCLTDAYESEAFQNQVEAQFARLKQKPLPVSLPFYGGWFCYFSYDYAEVVEPSLTLPSSNLPLAVWVRIPAAIIYDAKTHQVHFVAESGFQSSLEQMQADFDQVMGAEQAHLTPVVTHYEEEPEAKYLAGIDAIKDYILAGDIFQVNISREWSLTLEQADYVAVYDALRRSNPAPFAGCLNFGDWQILSSSPERLVKYRAPWVETRPIAGTRKRSDDVDADRALMEELISHPKERAEHIMLIDLERNDLGRICEPGTVEVNELMVVETYEHVHHIVSNVRGHLRAGMTPLQIIHATFPGGTITGCPKVRCMEIIAELEQMPRQAYTGSVGYVNRDGFLDMNILIRSMIHEEGRIRFRAGAGIVADSVAEKELQESRHKAKGLLKAFDLSQEGI